MNTKQKAHLEILRVPEFYTTAELARVAGVCIRTAQNRIAKLEILPDAILNRGTADPILLFSSDRLERLSFFLKMKLDGPPTVGEAETIEKLLAENEVRSTTPTETKLHVEPKKL
jgi:hypothetical protein